MTETKKVKLLGSGIAGDPYYPEGGGKMVSYNPDFGTAEVEVAEKKEPDEELTEKKKGKK